MTTTVLTSRREGRRSVSIEHLFPAMGYRFLTDDQVEEVRQVALSGDNVVLSPRLAMEFVADWRNLMAEQSGV